MRSVELFAGCGGLALGLARAGFFHEMVVELDDQANQTLEENKRRRVEHMACWPIRHGDVSDIEYESIRGAVDLVSGGPPCQPFSIGGKHLGPADPRNMWPEAVRAVRALRPKAFLFENVRGLLRPAFATYLHYLKLYLSWPEIEMRANEDWAGHHRRLANHQLAHTAGVPSFRVVFRAINTADYGAAQKRHRAMVMGIRSDVSKDWEFPEPTHSREALAWAQYVSQDYWMGHGLDPKRYKGVCDRDDRLVDQLWKAGKVPPELPWVTVRDAIGDLPDPKYGNTGIKNHDLHPGARVYPRHTGSRWDEPAKALKAGDHGVPGGENVLAPGDGSVRYFTLREMARLQGFPEEFVIPGTWKAPIKQLGNAVPVQIGESFGGKIAGIIRHTQTGASSVAAKSDWMGLHRRQSVANRRRARRYSVSVLAPRTNRSS